MAKDDKRDDDDDEDEVEDEDADEDEDRDDDEPDDDDDEPDDDDDEPEEEDDDEGDEPSQRSSRSATTAQAKQDEPRSNTMLWLGVVGVALLGGWWFLRNPEPETPPTAATSEPARRPPVGPPPSEPKPSQRELAIPPEPTETAAPAASAPPPTPTVTAAPARSGFDKLAALKAIADNTKTAARCRMRGEPAGTAQISVTFEPSGKVKESKVMPGPFLGTATGKCIAEKIASTTIPPFPGDAQTVIAPVQVH